MFRRVACCLVLSIIVLAGAARSGPSADSQKTSSDRCCAAAERRLAKQRLPEVAREADLVRDVYQFVGAHLDLMQQMPCYCGCKELGHRSAAECFVEHPTDAKHATWNTHGAGCGMCIGIAREAMTLQRQNVPAAEIRRRIETKYGPRH